MYIIVEGYRYQTEAAKVVLQKIHPLEQDRAISMYYVGYYYSNELNDTIFFLPKVVIDENGKLFGNPKYDPEELINLSKSLENGNIDPTDYDFIYGLSVWIYRAISEFKEQQKRQTENGEIEETTIVYNRSIANVSHVGDDVSNTYLDIMLSLIRFSEENQEFITFVIKNISGKNDCLGYYLIRLPRMSRVSSFVMERVAALVAFFTTRPVAEVFDLVFLPVTLSLT